MLPEDLLWAVSRLVYLWDGYVRCVHNLAALAITSAHSHLMTYMQRQSRVSLGSVAWQLSNASLVVGFPYQRCLATAFKLGFPATGATIAAAAGSGSCAGLLVRAIGSASSNIISAGDAQVCHELNPISATIDGPTAVLRLSIVHLTSTPLSGAIFGSITAVVRKQNELRASMTMRGRAT